MLFNIEGDVGAIVKGYVIPDSYDAHSRIVVRSGGQEVFSGPANHPMEYTVVPGRHADHACRFYIDINQCKDLDKFEDLEVREKETDQLIYRRRTRDHVSKKLFRLESHLLPLWRLDRALDSKFQYSGTRLENLGRETLLQTLTLWHVDSVYLTGRVLYRSIETYLDNGFHIAFVMHHPYEELAERIFVLRQMKETGTDLLGTRDAHALRPVISFVADLPLADDRALARALRGMPADVARALANPATLQLTSLTPDEPLAPRALTQALTTLASFRIVGLRRAARTFLDALCEFVETPCETLPITQSLPGVKSLAQRLRATGAVDGLLELDLQLYRHIAEAYRKAGVAPAAQSAQRRSIL